MPSVVTKIDKKFNSLYDDLKHYLVNLQDKFLTVIPPTETNLEKYELEIKAYCILSHGAIEEYIEKVSTEVMQESINNYIGKKRIINAALLSLIGCYGKIEIDNDKKSSEKKSFDCVKGTLDEVKREFSKNIYDNHGISIIHLRNLLTPVSIHVKEDVDLKDSLKQLSKERGSYAHSGSGVKKIIAPPDAKSYVKDCRELCLDIRNKAKKIFK